MVNQASLSDSEARTTLDIGNPSSTPHAKLLTTPLETIDVGLSFNRKLVGLSCGRHATWQKPSRWAAVSQGSESGGAPSEGCDGNMEAAESRCLGRATRGTGVHHLPFAISP